MCSLTLAPFSCRLPLATLAMALCLSWSATAAPPRSLQKELKLWVQLVESEKRTELLSRIPAKGHLLFRTVGDPSPQEPRRLTRDQIGLELEAGKGNRLGLAKELLLPRAQDLARLAPGRWKATDRRCPEVTWIFEGKGSLWRLVEVVRTLLSC